MADAYEYVVGVGLCLPERATLNAALSTFSQFDAVSGVPEPQNVSDLVVAASGPAPSETLDLQTQRSGFAALDGGSTFIWKTASAADTAWNGHDEPTSITDARWLPNVTGLDSSKAGDVLGLTDGAVLIASPIVLTSPATEPRRVRVYRIEPDGSSAFVDVVQTAADPSFQTCSLVQLQNGRVILLSVMTDSVAASRQVRADYSDDGGATWGLISPAVLPSSLPSTGGDFIVTRMSASSVDNTICLLLSVVRLASEVETYRDQVIQLASRDGAASFFEVFRTDEDDTRAGFAQMANASVVTTPSGVLLAAWLGQDGAAYKRILGDAFDPLDAGNASLIDSLGIAVTPGAFIGSIGAVVCELCAMPDGRIYGLLSTTSPNYSVRLVVSTDGGNTFRPAFVGPLGRGIYWRGAVDQWPSFVKAASLAGRLMVLQGGPDALSAAGVAYYHILGGASTVTLPPYYGSSRPTEQVAWTRSWWIDEPTNWPHITAAGMGGTVSTTVNGWQIATTGAPPTRLYVEGLTASDASFAEVLAGGIIRRYVMRVVSGGSLLADAVVVRFDVATSAGGFSFSVRHSATAAVVWDNNASALIGAGASGLTADTDYEWMVAVTARDVDDHGVRLWYRLHTFARENPWILVADGDLDDSPDTNVARIQWGHGGGVTATSIWRLSGTAYGVWTGTQLPEPYTNPRDLNGRPWPGRASVIQSTGAAVRAVGLSVRGDAWELPRDSDTRIENILTGGPRRGWEAEDDAEQTLIYDLSGENTITETDQLVVAAFGANVGWVKVVGVPLSGPEVTLYDGTVSTGLDALSFASSTNRVLTGSGTFTNRPTFAKHELSGAQFSTYQSGSWRSRTIRTNREGKWTDATTAQAAIILDTDIGTFSGNNGIIVPKDWAVQISMRGQEFRRLKIVIPTPNTTNIPRPAGNRWKIGRLFIGHVVAYPQPLSYGDRVTHEPVEETVESRDGQRTGLELAPTRRRYRVGWVDGTVTYRLGVTTTGQEDGDPQYFIVDSGADPAGLVGYEILSLDGVLRATRGAQELVWLSNVRTTQTGVHNRREQLALVYLDSDTARERFAGPQTPYGDALRGDVIDLVEAT